MVRGAIGANALPSSRGPRMSELQACMSVFAVACWASTDESLVQALKAIDLYEDMFEPQERLAAIDALKRSFDDLNAPGRVADAVRARLDERVAVLAVATGADGGDAAVRMPEAGAST